MFAFGIIAGAFDFVLAAFLAEVAEFLPRHAQGVVHLRGANASLVEFPFHFGAARFEALLFRAQRFHLALMFRGLLGELLLFLQERIVLQDQRSAPRDQVLKFLRHSRRERFGAGEAFRERGHLRAPCRQVFLLRLRILAQSGLLLHRANDFLFRSRARAGNFAAPLLRGFGAPLRRGGIVAQPRKFGLAGAQFHAEPHHVAARLIALQRGRHGQFFRFHVLRHGLFERQFAGAKLFFDVMQRRLRFRSRAFELQHFGIERPQFALHSQRPGFRWAAAAHHAALIRGAVGCDK